MKKRVLSLVLAAALLLAGVPLSASALGGLPNFRMNAGIIYWDNEFTANSPYPGSASYGFSEFTFEGFEPGKTWTLKKSEVEELDKYRILTWNTTGDYGVGHISVDMTSLMQYWSAMSDKPYEYGDYTITVWAGSSSADRLAETTFTYKGYTPKYNRLHGIYLKDGYATPKVGEYGDTMVVHANDKSGYTFDHWQVDSGEITLADPHSATTSFSMPDENVMLTPVYFKNGTLFAVSFDPNGGSGAMASQVVQAGQEFTFPACAFTPPAGKVFDYWSVAGKKNSFFEPGDSMEVTGDVTVRANWKDKSSGPSNPFVDVPSSQYYYEPVLWAVGHSPVITTGTDSTHFSPSKTCTRAQVVTFLWRAAGEPEPSKTTSPFTDVQDKSQYYYKAVLWAVEKGITNGATPTTFNPKGDCTRGQVVTFLWRAQHEPAPGSTSNPFVDVPAGQYYYQPVLWAVNHTPQITNGTDSAHFSPSKTCTRGQVVAFLWRNAGEPEP